MKHSNQSSKRLRVEFLEPRLALSLTFGFDALEVAGHHRPGHAGGPGGGDPPEPPTESAIDLPTVVAHEAGHALGLKHSNSPLCGSQGQPIMCPFYLGSAFSLQQEDVDRINGLYPESGAPDTTNAQGRWDDATISAGISYSFMPDGTLLEQQTVRGGGPPRLESDTNTLFATLNANFATQDWQDIFSDALALWADASASDGTDTELTFSEVNDGGADFDTNGNQGDIRFGAHTFDGASGTLAHGYYAPPNGNTAAGDVHLDEAETWQDLRNSPISASTSARIHVPSQAQDTAAGNVSGLVRGEMRNEPLIAAAMSSFGLKEQVADKESKQQDETIDNQELGHSSLTESFRVAHFRRVDKMFADVGEIHTRESHTNQSELLCSPLRAT